MDKHGFMVKRIKRSCYSKFSLKQLLKKHKSYLKNFKNEPICLNILTPFVTVPTCPITFCNPCSLGAFCVELENGRRRGCLLIRLGDPNLELLPGENGLLLGLGG